MSEIPPNEFDQTLPPQPTRLVTSQTRLVLDDKAIPLDNQHPDARTLYQAIHAALLSEWWQQTLVKETQLMHKSHITAFLNWLNGHDVNEANRFDLLNDYQAYRVNEANVLPQSTGIKTIIIILREGSVDDDLTAQQQGYIRLLIESADILENEEPVPDTLTGWFTQMDWLRPLAGEDDWLAMESPKRLMASFSVTVASTLLWVLRVKSAITELAMKNPHLDAEGVGLQPKQRMINYCRELLTMAAQHSSALPDGTLELLLADFVSPIGHEECRKRLHDGRVISKAPKIDDRYRSIFITPQLFHPEHLATPSPLEQYLAAWLYAWQTVQSTDIRRLKPNHFCIHYNKKHRPVGVQCVYYKGRSGPQEPPLLDATLIEAKALIKYLKTSARDGQVLFPDVKLAVKFAPDSMFGTLPGALTKIWELPALSAVIHTHLNARSASDRFRRLYLAVAHNGSQHFGAWVKAAKKNDQPAGIEAYREAVARPLPYCLFGFTAVKTSSVQARTDRYRDGDLINTNSHTAGTEKTSYMTDQNKEWVNLNGRITRTVLDDIEHHAYKPNINTALDSARERRLQTKVMQATGNQKVRINPLGQVITPPAAEGAAGGEPDEHIVWDTPDTVVYFLHYLSEAERQANQLIAHALPFFERTVLPSAEWMASLLNNGLSPGVVKSGKEQYERLRGVLPPLFDNQLHGGVGT